MRSLQDIVRNRPLLDLVPHFTTYLWYRIWSELTTLGGRILLSWWKVRTGRNIVCNGIPIIRRHPCSQISIGSNSIFSSKSVYNLIGINRRCSLATLASGAVINVGNNCGFSGTVIGAQLSITIGNNVRCGANTLITDTDWHTDDPRSSPPQPVVIEDNVWLGVNVTVLKGVRIGANSLIGAGSVVTRDIPANVVAAGIPAKIIRSVNVT